MSVFCAGSPLVIPLLLIMPGPRYQTFGVLSPMDGRSSPAGCPIAGPPNVLVAGSDFSQSECRLPLVAFTYDGNSVRTDSTAMNGKPPLPILPFPWSAILASRSNSYAIPETATSFSGSPTEIGR